MSYQYCVLDMPKPMASRIIGNVEEAREAMRKYAVLLPSGQLSLRLMRINFPRNKDELVQLLRAGDNLYTVDEVGIIDARIAGEPLPALAAREKAFNWLKERRYLSSDEQLQDYLI